MEKREIESLWDMMGSLFKAHPWHGIEIGKQSPEIVNTYVEMVPSDIIKYELDKATGLLKVDRPQKFSSMPPMLYGFIPRTLCDENVASFCMKKTGRTGINGDGDALDICIMTERPIEHSNIIVPAVPVGGFRMVDGNEADDKIIAYLKGDLLYSEWRDICDIPETIVKRLRHYFLTYKDIPGTEEHNCEITHMYDRKEAYEVIRLSSEDYNRRFKEVESNRTLALMQELQKICLLPEHD